MNTKSLTKQPQDPIKSSNTLSINLQYLEKLRQLSIPDDLVCQLCAITGETEVIHYFYQQGYGIHKLLPLAVASGQLEVLRYLREQGVDLKPALAIAMLTKQINIIQYLHENNLIASVLSEDSHKRLTEINEEIISADPIYHPSEFWNVVGDSQRAHLRFGGEDNFKRTINQSYCNFIPSSLEDPLILHLNKYFQHINVAKERYSLTDPDFDPTLWFSFYAQYQIFQGDRDLKKELYLLYVSTLYEHTIQVPETSVLRELEEPELGNPIKLYRDGKLISQDLITSVTERANILKQFSSEEQKKSLLIGELGAGYGRLAYVFLKTTQCRYMIFDIPPALHIAEWYLSSCFPEKKVFKFRHFDNYSEIEQELENADIAFFTPNQLELFPKKMFDAFVTISSLHEMSREQIKHYIQLISVATKKVIYIKQYWKYINPFDNLCITADEYIFPNSFSMSEKSQDILNPLFFEMTAIRKLETQQSPTISVLLSNYNHAHYLPESLSAICEQSTPADEIIIIDDGSTDNSIEVIESFKQKYPQIKLLYNLENKGLVYSINRALKASTGDYIVWASADDKLLPHFIKSNLKALELHPEAALSFSQLAVFDDKTHATRIYCEENNGKSFNLGQEIHSLTPKELTQRLQLSYLWMSGNTVVAKRKAVLEMGGFPAKLCWHTEWYLYYAIAFRYGVVVIPETLAMMREHANTYSKKGMSDRIAQFRVLSALLKTIYNNKVISQYFIQSPALLSPFGRFVLLPLAINPRYYKLFWRYLNWYIFFYQQYHTRLFNKMIRLLKKIYRSLPHPKFLSSLKKKLIKY